MSIELVRRCAPGFRFLVVLVSLVALAACQTAPVTGRQELILASNSEMVSMASAPYGGFLKNSPPSKDKTAQRQLNARA